MTPFPAAPTAPAADNGQHVHPAATGLKDVLAQAYRMLADAVESGRIQPPGTAEAALFVEMFVAGHNRAIGETFRFKAGAPVPVPLPPGPPPDGFRGRFAVIPETTAP